MRTLQNTMRSEPQFGKKLEADHYHWFRGTFSKQNMVHVAAKSIF